MPNTSWTLHDVASIIPDTWDFESSKIELKWARYHQINIAKNKNEKSYSSLVYHDFTLNNAHPTTFDHSRSIKTKLPHFESPHLAKKWERCGVLKFPKWADSSTIYAPDFSILFGNLKTPMGCYELVRNPVHTNGICNHTEFDIPDSMVQSKFSYETI